MNSKLYFKIFTNCFIVKGINRSLILDIQRNFFQTIPTSMNEVLESFINKKSLQEVYDFYGDENKIIIDEYVDYLIKNDFGFFTNKQEFDLFIDMDRSFELPNFISNCIIEYSSITISQLKKITNNLENLFCYNIQFISYEELSLEKLKSLLVFLNKTNFKSIELVIKHSNDIINFISQIDKINFKITELIIHDSRNKNKSINNKTFNVLFIDDEIKEFSHCGIVDEKYFDINKEKVLESVNYNSCLHKKISIDKIGNIKNCPSMVQSFGNIKDTTLEEALNHPNFKKYWNITKDQIEVCKDCEFRHICTDCRAYVEDPINIYSKPLKCGYNPYTNEWSEWSTNPLKQKAIEFYGMKDLVKKDA